MKVNTFYPTIQGEGAMTGVPMIVLRLQGCSVGCPWCDTKETWDADGGIELHPAEIAKRLARYREHPDTKGIEWILLTGGEPAEQDLSELIPVLHEKGWRVALETSGTAPLPANAGFDFVTVSPKMLMPGKKLVLATALLRADEIKHVVGSERDIDMLDTLLNSCSQSWPGTMPPVTLQPVSQSEKATRLCTRVCLERGWRLSVQVHKVIGLP